MALRVGRSSDYPRYDKHTCLVLAELRPDRVRQLNEKALIETLAFRLVNCVGNPPNPKEVLVEGVVVHFHGMHVPLVIRVLKIRFAPYLRASIIIWQDNVWCWPLFDLEGCLPDGHETS